MSDAKRYRISYRYGVIEDDGSPVFPAETSEPMVRAADYDVLKSQLAEAKEQRAADLAALTLKDEQIAACEGDARRYRWLRNDCATFPFPPYIVGHDVNSVSSCEQLDAAIDAHLSADKGEG